MAHGILGHHEVQGACSATAAHSNLGMYPGSRHHPQLAAAGNVGGYKYISPGPTLLNSLSRPLN